MVIYTHVYHCVASVLPIEEIVLWAHDVGAKVLVDACQSVPHMVIDVQNLNVDFLVASSHKVRILQYCIGFRNFILMCKSDHLRKCFRCVGLQALGSYMENSIS